MQRVTITLDDELMQALDARMRAQGHANRSETVRDLVRAGLAETTEAASESGQCVGALVYVYDHDTRQLSQRLTGAQHAHHDLSIATLHVHLDHESCMEVAVLRGAPAQVKHFADHITGERGVRYGRLVTIPVDVAAERHGHGAGAHPHAHTHVRTRG